MFAIAERQLFLDPTGHSAVAQIQALLCQGSGFAAPRAKNAVDQPALFGQPLRKQFVDPRTRDFTRAVW